MLANLIKEAQTNFAQAQHHMKDVIETKFHKEVTDYVPSNSIAITQVSGQANFVLMPTGTYADPDPIKTANTEKFNVSGIWNIDASTLDKVEFTCKLQGVQVYKQDFKCATGDANCPLPAGTVGEQWAGMFTFDVPGFAPPFEYDVHVKAYKADNTELFDLESKFRI